MTNCWILLHSGNWYVEFSKQTNLSKYVQIKSIEVLPRKALSEKSQHTLVLSQIFNILGISEKMQKRIGGAWGKDWAVSSSAVNPGAPKHCRNIDLVKKTSHTVVAVEGSTTILNTYFCRANFILKIFSYDAQGNECMNASLCYPCMHIHTYIHMWVRILSYIALFTRWECKTVINNSPFSNDSRWLQHPVWGVLHHWVKSVLTDVYKIIEIFIRRCKALDHKGPFFWSLLHAETCSETWHPAREAQHPGQTKPSFFTAWNNGRFLNVIT